MPADIEIQLQKPVEIVIGTKAGIGRAGKRAFDRTHHISTPNCSYNVQHESDCADVRDQQGQSHKTLVATMGNCSSSHSTITRSVQYNCDTGVWPLNVTSAGLESIHDPGHPHSLLTFA